MLDWEEAKRKSKLYHDLEFCSPKLIPPRQLFWVPFPDPTGNGPAVRMELGQKRGLDVVTGTCAALAFASSVKRSRPTLSPP